MDYFKSQKIATFTVYIYTTLTFSNIIIHWYEENKRDLPWRTTKDAYIIWVSEVILQQTRVAQGLAYFVRFIERFPSVTDLAKAEEAEVLKYWQGLGYYSRARNMHKAAKKVMESYAGIFPTDYTDLLTLQGIGDYTAAAISSFSNNQPHAVVDGNVYRVLSRVFGINIPINSNEGKKEFKKLAQSLLLPHQAATYNQAIMEFGALQCVPASPVCANCPLQAMCYAFEHKQINSLPVKETKKTTKTRYFFYFDIRNEEYTYLQQRTHNDIWHNLFEYPLLERDTPSTTDEILTSSGFLDLFDNCGNMAIEGISSEIKHVLSHQIIRTVFIRITIEKENNALQSLLKINSQDIEDYPVSRLMHKYIEKNMG